MATLPVDYARAVEATAAEAVHLGDSADHRGAVLFGVRDRKGWFDNFVAKAR